MTDDTVKRLAEKWKTIPETRYKVSNRGRIKNRVILKPRKNSRGYPIVCIWKKDGTRYTQRVHILVANAFLGHRPEGFQTNHIDGNRWHNWASNLEYVTPSQNTLHSFANHLSQSGENHHKAKLTLAQVAIIRGSESSVKDLAKAAGVGVDAIRRIRNGRSWRHYG